MRAFDRGAWFSVAVNYQDISDFCQNWPCSGLDDLNGSTFIFETGGGDLVDIMCNNGNRGRWDGPALSALSEDAKKYGYAMLRARPRAKLSAPMRSILYWKTPGGQ